jgi:hypothetical protein
LHFLDFWGIFGFAEDTGILSFFRISGFAEDTGIRKSKKKKVFFLLLFSHFFVSLALPKILAFGRAKRKKCFFFCSSLIFLYLCTL